MLFFPSLFLIRAFLKIREEIHHFLMFLRSGGDFGVDFQIPRIFPRLRKKIIQIGALEARIRPFFSRLDFYDRQCRNRRRPGLGAM